MFHSENYSVMPNNRRIYTFEKTIKLKIQNFQLLGFCSLGDSKEREGEEITIIIINSCPHFSSFDERFLEDKIEPFDYNLNRSTFLLFP